MNEDFLRKLQSEAKQQKKLYSSRILPPALDPITSYVGENSFLVISLLSIFSATILEFVNQL